MDESLPVADTRGVNSDQDRHSADEVEASEVEAKFEAIASRIRLGRRMRMTRGGEPQFALVSLEDLFLLEHLDQVADLEAIEAQLNDELGREDEKDD